MSIFEKFTSRKPLPPSKEEEVQELLNDLRLVGVTKPLGYLPISTLRDVCGVELQEMREELEAKGLVVMELTEQETNVGSGALYTYDRDALSRVLESDRLILEKNGWPTEPDEFIRHLKFFAKDPDLYKLVMQVFADTRLKKK